MLHYDVCHLKYLLTYLITEGETSSPAGPWTNNTNILVAVSHLLITINSSANFLIYCYKVHKGE